MGYVIGKGLEGEGSNKRTDQFVFPKGERMPVRARKEERR